MEGECASGCTGCHAVRDYWGGIDLKSPRITFLVHFVLDPKVFEESVEAPRGLGFELNERTPEYLNPILAHGSFGIIGSPSGPPSYDVRLYVERSWSAVFGSWAWA